MEMFSHNGQISEKQMRRMLILTTFAGSMFVIPYLSANLFGKSIVPGLFFFLLLGIIYVTYIFETGKYLKYKNSDGAEKIEKMDQRHIGMDWLLGIVQVVRLMIRLIFYIVLSVAILGEGQVPFMQGRKTNQLQNMLVVLPLLLVSIYGAKETRIKSYKREEREKVNYLGIEKQGRIFELIFWTLFVPFLFMLLFGLGEVDNWIFLPQMDMPLKKVIFYGYTLLTFLLPVENYLYLNFRCREHSRTRRRRTCFLTLAVLLLICVLTLILQGIYGIRGAGQEEMLTIAIMRYIRLPFGVLERFDVLMVWFFMTGCFALICSTLFYIGSLLSTLFCNVRRGWILITVAGTAWLFALCLPEYSATLSMYLHYGAWVDVPLSVLLPMLRILMQKIKRKNIYVRGNANDEVIF